MADIVRCPKCDCEIDVASVLAAQVRGDLQRQFEADSRKKNQEIAAREEALNHQQEKLVLRQNELDNELKKRVEAAFAEREETLGQRDKELIVRQKKLDDEIAQRLEGERTALEATAMEKAKKTAAAEVGDLTVQLTEAQKKVEEAQKAELELRKDRRELEQKQKELELEVARTLDLERVKIREQAVKEVTEATELKDAEAAKRENDLRRQVSELQRKMEQGSQQLQGEVLELALEQQLAQQFPSDQISPVPKGVHGGDIVHRVIDNLGRDCGAILWEAKRTKNWSKDWLPKLRDDQRTAKAQIAVLVSVELPKDIAAFGQRDGIWISDRAHAVGLALALRAGLVEISKAMAAVEGRQEKTDLVYNYLSSVEFENRVKGILEAFTEMRKDLSKERAAMERHWAKREKQLNLVIKNTSGLHGDLAAIMGRALPIIQLLELPNGNGDESLDE